MFEKQSLEDVIKHYGTKHKSGRYPWGSGKDPVQHSRTFLSEYQSHKAKGLGEKEIAAKMGLNTTQLRNKITYANSEMDSHNRGRTKELKEQGMSNVAIGKILGVSEATVRNYLSQKTAAEKTKATQLENINAALKSGVERTGYLDVGVGVERQLGIPRNKFNTVVNKLAEDGEYYIHEVHIPRLNTPPGQQMKYTTTKVLTKDPDKKNTSDNSHKIRPLDTWSEDGAVTLSKMYRPHMIDLNRIKIRYSEDGGAEKDGLIELRKGVKDLDLGLSKYAQVRIGAGENFYLKGMAAYSDDAHFPKGVDVIFNTNKGKGTPPEKVFKPLAASHKDTDDPSALFGSSVIRQKGALNIVNEQGDWDRWKGTMSSQFLGKQPLNLIKDRLDDTYAGIKREYDEINSLTNPIVKKYLMESFRDGLDAKAKHLKAKGLPNTKSHVLMPFPDMKPNEIYATNYKDGERVVLVRHPHGGKFEIPELVVNNKHATAKKMLGDAKDAVGIHPSVAEVLSGADFDGDTALVIPNNKGMIKTERPLKELKNFDPKMYKVDHDTITTKYKNTLMGVVSNLITDMTIKGASNSELARAVKHSMVVIDSEKHKLDYKESARQNGIQALINKYQVHTNPETGKVSRGASTLLSRSKQKIDISQHETAKNYYKDKVDKNGKILKKGMTPEEIAVKLKISVDTVNGYLFRGEKFNPDKYVSGTAQEELYSSYIKGIMAIKNEAIKSYDSIKAPEYDREAAKKYAPEVQSLNVKLNRALLNAPKERQAQILTNKLYWDNYNKDMDKDQIKKLKNRSLAKARVTTGANRGDVLVDITPKEWEAIQAHAISTTKVVDILKNTDLDKVRKLASPREPKLSTARAERARVMIEKGYTYAQVAEQLGVSTETLRREL